MANSTLTDLTAASTLDGTELVYTVQGAADRKATVTQINASRQPLDATLTALSGLNADAGFLYQTSADSFIKTDLTAAHMAALRTFVRPPGGVAGAGGFYQQNLYEIALNTPDALCGQVTVNVSITDTDPAKTGAYFYRAVFLIHRYVAGIAYGESSVPAGLIQTAYLGSAGTSIGVVQFQVNANAPGAVLFLIQPVGFTSPTVTITAVMVLPGTNAVTIL